MVLVTAVAPDMRLTDYGQEKHEEFDFTALEVVRVRHISRLLEVEERRDPHAMRLIANLTLDTNLKLWTLDLVCRCPKKRANTATPSISPK